MENIIESKGMLLTCRNIFNAYGNFEMQTDQVLEHNRPYLVVVDRVQNIWCIVNVACTFHSRISQQHFSKSSGQSLIQFESLTKRPKYLERSNDDKLSKTARDVRSLLIL